MKRKYIFGYVIILVILFLTIGDKKRVNAEKEETEQLSEQGYDYQS